MPTILSCTPLFLVEVPLDHTPVKIIVLGYNEICELHSDWTYVWDDERRYPIGSLATRVGRITRHKLHPAEGRVGYVQKLGRHDAVGFRY
ncbi:hypothetical protein NQ317_016164 [Molorchus minor]|uniref:Uncharacterized protein n=1 Tax=Molorchus minor TaxID=1323400 RepID=A0ABQ9IQ57_9CUCU|nr:hypothetical protein NQ317_016164 [Molorchus minor]